MCFLQKALQVFLKSNNILFINVFNHFKNAFQTSDRLTKDYEHIICVLHLACCKREKTFSVQHHALLTNGNQIVAVKMLDW